MRSRMDSVISTSRPIACLEEFAQKVWKDCGIELSFCRVDGKRWSFVAGGQHELLAASEQIMLTDGMGISVEGYGLLSPARQKMLVQKARALVKGFQEDIQPGAPSRGKTAGRRKL